MLTACHLLSLPRLLLRFLAKSRATLRASLQSLSSSCLSTVQRSVSFLLEEEEEEEEEEDSKPR